VMTLLLAAVTASTIHLNLESGASVDISYVNGDVSESDAIKDGVSFAKFAWKDFCGSSSACSNGDVRIYISHGSCSVDVSGRAPYPSGAYYVCYFKIGDPKRHLTRTTQELPPVVATAPQP
jgi:hypothetical protein